MTEDDKVALIMSPIFLLVAIPSMILAIRATPDPGKK